MRIRRKRIKMSHGRFEALVKYINKGRVLPMREYLFRGKRTDNDEWAVGYLIVFPKSKRTKILVWNAADLDFDAIEVIPETVGQFTGLTDKNGKRVFEGDIIKWRWWFDVYMGRDVSHLWRVDWSEESGLITFVDSPTTKANLSIHNAAGDRNMDNKIGKYEVVGNIYDHPELMEDGT